MDCQKLYEMLNSPLSEGLLGAVIGAVIGSGISGFFILRQTRILLTEERRFREEERRLREEERERETKSVAAALLWEIDDFYKLSIRDVCRALKDVNLSGLGFQAKSPTYKNFSVFEASAGKIGSFEPPLIQAITGYYGSSRAYLNTMSDYGKALEQFQSTAQPHLRMKSIALLEQIKNTSQAMVPLTQTVCAELAKRGGTEYTFDAP
jgi:hypothetical protein